MKGIRRPAPHPPRWAYDVVRATYRLPGDGKHVWRIVNEFDATAGCWASPALLAKLTGIPLDAFLQHLEGLIDLGLIIRTEQGGRAILFAALPGGMPQDAKLERQDKLLCAERLDRHIAEVRLGIETNSHNNLPESESLTAVPLISSPAVNCSPEKSSRPSKETGAFGPEKTAMTNGSPHGGIPNEELKASVAILRHRLAVGVTPESPESLAQKRARFRGMVLP